MENIILHIDVNNAFLSWTAVKLLHDGYKVDIRNIPAVIGGDEKNRTGIVLAKSIPAKKMGIRSAMTLFQAKKICPNISVFPPDYKYYSKMSRMLFDYLFAFSPDIEIASIDECYMDYTKVKGLYGDEVSFANRLRKEIKEKFDFTVNVGIANNKLCAKMASDFLKPDRTHTLYFNEIKEKMFPLSIDELFGVGKSTADKLKMLGINTISDLANFDPNSLKRIFKKQAIPLIERANGIDNSIVDSSFNFPKGISNEITLSSDVNSVNVLKDKLFSLSQYVSNRIRKEKKYASVVCLILKNSFFNRTTHQKKLKNPINSYSDIYREVCSIFDKFYSGEDIRLIGIRLDGLVNEVNYQTSLFENFNPDDLKIDRVMDQINEKYGKNIIKRAEYIDLNRK